MRRVPLIVDKEERPRNFPEIRGALVTNTRLEHLGKLPSEEEARKVMQAVQARHEAEQARRETERKAERGATIGGEIDRPREQNARGGKRKRLVKALEGRYGDDVDELVRLLAEPQKVLAYRLGVHERTWRRASNDWATHIALGVIGRL
jgi:hypothetical protein